MTQEQFKDYYHHLMELFGLKGLNGSALQSWYKPFQTVPLEVAYEMADIFMANAKGKPTPAGLLEYKNMAFRNLGGAKTETFDNCKICNNTGFILMTSVSNGISYEAAYRCLCKKGDSMSHSVPQISLAVFNNSK